ncbi:MAG: hypothetical protein MRZ42_00245 [Tenericutes bacterium]|nr:hypothetical protein [Mycoplasmatota bacterium]
MMDKDIKEMFREKNKVILLNNLKYDLDKNINSLLETIINIFNLEFDTAIKNILAINEDSGIVNSDKFITNSINEMKLASYEEIEKLLNIKKETLEKSINQLEFEEESLNDYYNKIFDTTRIFKDSFTEYSITNIQNKGIELLNKFILDKVDEEKEELALSRITDYLKNRLYGKLETKIHMELMLRDNNLINKAKESYLRFQEISNKTTKVA